MRKSQSSTTTTYTKSQRLLERLESINIIPSDEVLALEDYAEIELKYILGNVHTDDELKQIELFGENKRTSDDASGEHVDDEKIRERFSKFSLMSTHTSSKDGTRLGAMASIVNEEKLRSKTDVRRQSNRLSKSQIIFASDNFKQTIDAFKKIKQKLEDIRHFCPSLYYNDKDIFTIWGNMLELSADKKNKPL